jgi:glucosamine kinase
VRYVAGIDGGQSGTQAVIADERGRILGAGNAGPADENWQGPASTRMHDALKGALDEARENARLPADTRFAAVVAGVSGYEGRLYGAPPALPAERFSLVHDPEIAHAGAFRGGSGVVVIAGTGSIAYVVDDDGCTGISGGLGYVFGDEGSAFWIAKTAIASAISVNADCAVERAAKTFFGKETLRDVFAAFYHGQLDRDRFAAFAKVVLEIASSDDTGGGPPDECATETVDGAQRNLAWLAEHADDRRWHWTSRPRAAFVGGLMQDAAFKSGLYERVSMEVVEPAYPPAYGAVILALREAGIACDRLTE